MLNSFSMRCYATGDKLEATTADECGLAIYANDDCRSNIFTWGDVLNDCRCCHDLSHGWENDPFYTVHFVTGTSQAKTLTKSVKSGTGAPDVVAAPNTPATTPDPSTLTFTYGNKLTDHFCSRLGGSYRTEAEVKAACAANYPNCNGIYLYACNEGAASQSWYMCSDAYRW